METKILLFFFNLNELLKCQLNVKKKKKHQQKNELSFCMACERFKRNIIKK